MSFLGFGKVINRAARTGRNPQTGKAINIKIKSAKVLKFKPAKP